MRCELTLASLPRGLTRLRARLEPFQFFEDLIQAESLDELHDVVRQTLVLADPEDGHDVGVVQLRRSLCLSLKTLLGASIDQKSLR